MNNKNTNKLLNKIDKNYEQMSKGQKLLADYILKNYDKAVFLTAAKLGKVVGVSESTVVRFATQLGYQGYPGFQKALEELVRNKLYTTYIYYSRRNQGRSKTPSPTLFLFLIHICSCNNVYPCFSYIFH